jgi:hypothetical protein
LVGRVVGDVEGAAVGIEVGDKVTTVKSPMEFPSKFPIMSSTLDAPSSESENTVTLMLIVNPSRLLDNSERPSKFATSWGRRRRP